MSDPIARLARVKRRLAQEKLSKAEGQPFSWWTSRMAKDKPVPYVDVAPFFVPVVMAMVEGRPFSRLPTPDVELSEEAEQALRRTMAELDRVAARLEADDPGGAERFQVDVERKRAANLRAIEREQAARLTEERRQ
jgi:hypothetical protein